MLLTLIMHVPATDDATDPDTACVCQCIRLSIVFFHCLHPGPRFSTPIVGHLPLILKRGSMTVYADFKKKYGPIFKVCEGILADMPIL
jgi:hypothetical protein